MFNKLIAYAADRLAKHREYRRIVDEISGMSQRDLLDIGAFQVDLYKAAHEHVYGA